MSVDNKIKFSLTCRLCANLITDSVLLPLHFSFNPKEKPPIAIIKKYTNNLLQIDENDDLPKQICNNCLRKIKSYNEFLNNSINAQERLRRYFSSKKSNGNKKSLLFDFDNIEKNEPISDDAKINRSKYSDFSLENGQISSQDIEGNEGDETMFEEIEIKEEVHSQFSDFELSDCESNSTSFNDNFVEDFRFICHICNIELKSEWRLEKHLINDHNLKENDRVLCEHCGENLNKRTYFHHIKELTSGNGYRCKYCDEEFVSQAVLCTHYNSKHRKALDKSQYEFECPKCKRKFKSLVYMQKHLIVSHNKKREENPRYKPNACKYCGQVYGRSDHLQLHIKRAHLKMLDFECFHCGKCYTHRYQLNNHIKLAHSEKKIYKCDFCTKTYINEKHFKDHILEHSNEPKFKCVLCGILFHKLSLLKKHEATHNSESTSCLMLEIERSDNNDLEIMEEESIEVHT